MFGKTISGKSVLAVLQYPKWMAHFSPYGTRQCIGFFPLLKPSKTVDHFRALITAVTSPL